MVRSWTTSELESLKQMRDDGLTELQIAQALGRTRYAVRSRVHLMLSKGKLTPRRTHHVWATSEQLKAQKMYAAGHTARHIAQTLGVTVKAVWHLVTPRKHKK